MNTDTNKNQPHRDAILEAALMVIAENKISGTSMREIAKRAGISHGTLHYHFPSKAELLLSLLDEIDHIFNERRSREFAKLNLNPTSRLHWILQQEQELLHNQRHLAEVFIDFWGQGLKNPIIRSKIQIMYHKWRSDIDDVIKEGIAGGEFNPRVANLVPGLLVSIMEGAALQYLTDEDAFDLETYFNLSYEMIIEIIEAGQTTRDPYPTDITDDQWELIAPLLPQVKSVGRPRNVVLREVVNAIVYVTQSSCSWRMMPHDFPHWKTVYGYYNKWGRDETLACISTKLGIDLRPMAQEMISE
jgi:putative transposase